MALSQQEIDALIQTVSLTRLHEPGCEECLQDVAEFAERSLAGKSIPEGLQAVQQHLAVCGECREEYSALLQALRESE